MRAMLLLAAGLLAAAGAPATGAPTTAGDATFSSPMRFLVPDGATIYRDVCQGCHMPDGLGATGAGRYPSLAGDTRLDPQDYAVTTVLHGHGAMPPFARQLSDQQVANIVSFIRTHFGNAYTAPVSSDDVKAAR